MEYKKLFGTDGIRGKFGEFPMTLEMAYALGACLAHRLGDQSKVAIGRDTRVSGPDVEAVLARGLSEHGAEVLLVGVLPTPAVAHVCKALQLDAGIMVSASHNPFEDNGIKIFKGDGYKLSDEEEDELEGAVLNALKFKEVGSLRAAKIVHEIHAQSSYVHYLEQAISEDLSHTKIIVDTANGSAFQVAPQIFERLGIEAEFIGNDPSGKNINDNCGALHTETLARLVMEHKAELGIAYDGDADRVIFIDEEAHPVSGDVMLAFIAEQMHATKNLREATIAATVMSNLGLEKYLNSKSIKVCRTQVGDRYVIEALRNKKLSFGGEESGHLIFSDVSTTGDGILASLLVLQMLKKSGQKLCEFRKKIKLYPRALVSFNVPQKIPLGKLKNTSKIIADIEGDLGSDGRVLARYSGTENKARVLVEGSSSQAVLKHAKAIETAWLNEL